MNMNKKGVTLAELVIASCIIGLVILTIIGSFGNISKVILFSKARTLATNLAQEKMQILKQMSYYKLLITSSPAYIADISPAIPYDPGYFPPERILEGGIYFDRFTYVQVAQEIGGKITTLPPSTPNTGMKLITVTVIWKEGKVKKFVQVYNIASEPYGLNGVIKGKVRNAMTLSGIPNATVIVAENIGWQDLTNASGDYSINVQVGSYRVMASAVGFFSANDSVSVGASPVTKNFDLVPMDSGTVSGLVWLNDHIVISQVVASTQTPDCDQEYLELYNPTTFQWQMAYFDIGTGSTIPVTGVKYHGIGPGATLEDIPLIYYTLFIPVSSYYLIANTTTITVAGVTKTADAVFRDNINVIKCNDPPDIEGGGGIGIYTVGNVGDTTDDVWIDIVGWDGTGGAGWKKAPIYETDGIAQLVGFQRGEQYVRRSFIEGGSNRNDHPGISLVYARCYDSNNNNGAWNNVNNYWRIGDFGDFGIGNDFKYPPMNSNDTQPYRAVTPAFGAIVTCFDGLSGGTVAECINMPTSPPMAPYSRFTLTSVATGTWTVMISSDIHTIEISSVTVLVNSTTGIPNALTAPQWKITGDNSVFLEGISDEGYITGNVINAYGQPIPNIRVEAMGYYNVTNSAGNYFIKLATGIYNVIANPGNLNPTYVESIKENIKVDLGQVTSGVNFILSQSGGIKGFVTRDGINPIPNIVFTAEDSNYVIKGDGISGEDGYFLITNLATGTYTVAPVLGSKETSTPAKSVATVTVGKTIFASTFTITGALGKITGTVTSGGKPIKEGILIVATTTTLTAPDYVPPVLSTATASGAPFFITNSYEDGTYIVEVIGSATDRYNMYAYYTTFVGDTPSIKVKVREGASGVIVNQGQTVTGIDFTW